jgi:hypothetical protein
MQADIDVYDVLAAMAGYAERLKEHVSKEDVSKINIGYIEAIVGKLQGQIAMVKGFAEEATNKAAA